LSLRDAVNHGPFHFLVDFQHADPDPVSYPDSRVERGACLAQIEMLLSLPFRNVTNVGGRAAGGRGAPA
jgi:hypothetical protein